MAPSPHRSSSPKSPSHHTEAAPGSPPAPQWHPAAAGRSLSRSGSPGIPGPRHLLRKNNSGAHAMRLGREESSMIRFSGDTRSPPSAQENGRGAGRGCLRAWEAAQHAVDASGPHKQPSRQSTPQGPTSSPAGSGGLRAPQAAVEASGPHMQPSRQSIPQGPTSSPAGSGGLPEWRGTEALQHPCVGVHSRRSQAQQCGAAGEQALRAGRRAAEGSTWCSSPVSLIISSTLSTMGAASRAGAPPAAPAAELVATGASAAPAVLGGGRLCCRASRGYCAVNALPPCWPPSDLPGSAGATAGRAAAVAVGAVARMLASCATQR